MLGLDGKPLPVTLPADFDARVNAFLALLRKWNGRINLVSRKLGPEELRGHVLASLAPLSLGLPSTGTLLDVGSGGGFPAIPLLLALPEWHGVVVESTTKKCLFLREVGEQFLPGRLDVRNERFEEMESAERSVDLVTLRAVRVEHRMVRHLVRFMEPGTRLAWFAPATEEAAADAVNEFERNGLHNMSCERIEWAGTSLMVQPRN